MFEEGIHQRDELTFWVFSEASPEVLEWLKNDCKHSFHSCPKFHVESGGSMGGSFGKFEWGKEIRFVKKDGAMEFKLRWWNNA